jgi:hypothetical protein
MMVPFEEPNRNTRCPTRRTLSIPVACYFLASFMVIPSQAGVEVVASKSLTVQTSGPRPGDAG